jgi:hypothetical protein
LGPSLYLHVINYNSPGATGALPMAAMIVSGLIKDGVVFTPGFAAPANYNEKMMWDPIRIAEQMKP